MKFYDNIPIDDELWGILKQEMINAVDKFLLNYYTALPHNHNSKHKHINTIGKKFNELEASDLPIYSHVSPSVCLFSFPSINNLLNQYNLSIKLGSIFIIYNDMVVHVDRSSRFENYQQYWNNRDIITSCLFPLANTENSVTEFYDVIHPRSQYLLCEKSSIIDFPEDSIKKVDEVVINKPMVIRTDFPHAVKNYSDKPRLIISLKFTTNPWILT